MKFKKVEISAFRIYDNPHYSTFDFTLGENEEAASFVSLYAPNGYGKTSFYDAIEWGITNNIHRFWQNKVITEGSINALKGISDKQIRLWRNTHSTHPTYVKITTDKKEIPRRDLYVHGNSKIDTTNFDQIQNKSFRQVILSQDWISAFLREVNGERRYEIFMENPDLKGLDEYYKGLKSIAATCDDKLKNLSDLMQEDKNKIQELTEGNLLETINSQISFIATTYNESDLSLITLATTKEQIKKLRDSLSTRIVNFDRKSKINDLLLEDILLARIGDEKVIGVDHYYKNLQHIHDIVIRFNETSALVKEFATLEKTTNEISNIKDYVNKLLERKEDTNNIILLFSHYERVHNEIEEKANIKKKIEAGLPDLIKQYELSTRNEIDYKNQFQQVIKELENIEEKIAYLPQLKENIFNVAARIILTETLLNEERESAHTKAENIKKFEADINELKKTIQKCETREYSFPSLNENPLLKNLIRGLELKLKEIYSEREKLQTLNLKIEQQQNLNSTILEFVKSGLSIVSDLKSSNCPLCQQSYSSHVELAERIANNNALSLVLQELLSEQNLIKSKLSSLEKDVNQDNLILIENYNQQLDAIIEKKINTQKELNVVNKSIETNLSSLAKHKSLQTEYLIQLNGLTVAEFESTLKNSQNLVNEKNIGLAKVLVDIRSKTDQINQQIKTQKDQLVLIKTEIDALYEVEPYLLVKDWFKKNYPNEVVDIRLLVDHNKALSGNIENSIATLNALEDFIENGRKKLSEYSQESLAIQAKDLEQKKVAVEYKIDSYKNFVKEQLEIDLEKIDKQSFYKAIEERESQYKVESQKSKDLHYEYLKLEKYCENIVDFLQSEQAKVELKEKEDEHSFILKNVRPLIVEEIARTKYHLQNKIKDFFYEDLINDLYRKIEPHPDFKEVHFHANFDAESPCLDVFVRNGNNTDILIPNLYFSTAQINILSLSIFLASALNSKDYDCIFIDDPIQSLDSINVLSTIDLLRSIVVNLNKQIILSTHDENFHNLLKKKIPANLFKSKFIELETFGKIKQ